MKLNHREWKALQLPLAVFGLALLAALALISYTGHKKAQALAALESQNNQLHQARQRFETSGAEKGMITEYMPLYLDLVRKGFIGEERRIEWIDDLRTINQQYKLFGIHYSIGAQENLKLSFLPDANPFSLHHSLMKIETPLLHEGDLLTILNVSSTRNLAPFMPRDCVISRLSGSSRGKFVPNLNATCEIDWLTVSEPVRAGAKP